MFDFDKWLDKIAEDNGLNKKQNGASEALDFLDAQEEQYYRNAEFETYISDLAYVTGLEDGMEDW